MRSITIRKRARKAVGLNSCLINSGAKMKHEILAPGIEIYQGDCKEIMSTFKDEQFDLVLTDPPYGIADIWVGGESSKHGWSNVGRQKEKRNGWDKKPNKETFDEIIRISKNQIIWGGNYFNLPISRGWLIWNKPERGFTLSEAELAWTSYDMPMRIFDCRRSDPNRTHPTQKPLSLMNWCLTFEKGVSVLDVYFGSGTTGVACVQTGRKFTGIEIDPDYYEIARKRIKEALMQPKLL